MGTRELKKRNHSKLLFGGVDIKKYASPSYIRQLLNHRREFLERPQDVAVEDHVDPEDVDVAIEDHVGDVPPLGINPALDQAGSLTNALGNPALEQGTNPLTAALTAAANLTNQLANEQPNNQLFVPTSSTDAVESKIHPTDTSFTTVANLTDQLANEQPNNQLVVPSSVADAVESKIHPTDTNLTDQLANEQPNNQLDISNGDDVPSSSVDVLPSISADVVESDIHPTDAALNYVSQLVGSFEEPDEEQLSESEPGEEPTRSISENPAIVALNIISGIVAELALQQPSAVPPVTGPVVTVPAVTGPLTLGTGQSTSSTVQVGDVPLTLTPVTGPIPSAAIQSTPSPTDEALDNILKFTQSLVSPLSTQTPTSIETPPIIETPPTQPNTSSSFLPKFSASGMLSGLNSLLPDDEDMTQYEVEEYTTALGSDKKQNERKTMYNSDGATSGQHKWRAQPAPANQSSQA